jgi:hypothetical protein
MFDLWNFVTWGPVSDKAVFSSYDPYPCRFTAPPTMAWVIFHIIRVAMLKYECDVLVFDCVI